jgi:iron(III) transport system permease protein
VSYFAVNTLTTAIYDTWLGYSNLEAAAKISAMMLLVVLLLLSSERYSRRKQRLFQNHLSHGQSDFYPLHGWKKWGASLWCWGLVSVAFILPVGQLFLYAYRYFEQSWTVQFQQYAMNSLYVSVSAAVIAVAIALLVNFSYRLSAKRIDLAAMRLASLGYAVPGTVLAIGVMAPMLTLDHWVNDVARWMDWGRPGLILSGSMVALIFAMVVRFAAVAIGSIENGLAKIPPSLDMASRSMGCSQGEMLKRIHIPLVKRGILVAGLLVFIESMKELNTALLLRPFNFETLATYVYNFASDEHLELAALPAVLLVLVGLIPLILINRSLETKQT